MQTATHEGREPWLDEGLTEYSALRYMAEAGRDLGVGPLSLRIDTVDRLNYNLDPGFPANLPAWEYDENVYGSVVYNKTALGLWTLERLVGTERFRGAMAGYLTAWRFKHPTAADFRTSLEQSLTGADLTWFFDDFIAGKGVIDYSVGAIQNSPAGSSVEIIRQGAVRVPVEVRLTFASGAQQTPLWDGQAEHTTLTFPASDPIVQVQIDPERKLVAELDIADNGLSSKLQVGPALILGGRLMFWLQSLLSLLGLFG
jgi:aminopeptidase N